MIVNGFYPETAAQGDAFTPPAVHAGDQLRRDYPFVARGAVQGKQQPLRIVRWQTEPTEKLAYEDR